MVCLGRDNSTHLYFDHFRAAVDSIMVTFIILGNLFILFAVLRHWKRQGIPVGNVTSTLLVINLSAADALIGISSIFFLLPEYWCSLSDQLDQLFLPCISRFVVMTVAYLASGYTLVAIAVDRYIAVMHAVRYPVILNTRRTMTGIAVIWLSATLGGTMFFYWHDWSEGKRCLVTEVIPIAHTIIFGVIGHHTFFILVASVVYWRIHQVAINLRMRKQQLTVAQIISSKSARALLLILSVYTVSCVPYTFIAAVHRMLYVPTWALEVTATLLDVNPMVNPFIYAHTNRPVRQAISSALAIFKRKVQHSSHDISSPSDLESKI